MLNRTLFDDPTDAELKSHRLLARGGYIRKIGADHRHCARNKYRDEVRPRFGLLRGRERTVRGAGAAGGDGELGLRRLPILRA